MTLAYIMEVVNEFLRKLGRNEKHMLTVICIYILISKENNKDPFFLKKSSSLIGSKI